MEQNASQYLISYVLYLLQDLTRIPIKLFCNGSLLVRMQLQYKSFVSKDKAK